MTKRSPPDEFVPERVDITNSSRPAVNRPRVGIVSFAESRGGSAKAAERLFQALARRGEKVEYVVVEKRRNASRSRAPSRYGFAWHFLKRLVARVLQSAQRSENPSKHSLNLFSCGYVLRSLRDFDLVHLQWINNETLSVGRWARIKGPIIITLHDEWLYCGSEHYALESVRPFVGYKTTNKNVVGFDWDRRVWNRKRKALASLKDRVVLTAPSRWIFERARSSKMLQGFDVRLIPNCIDVHEFYPRKPSNAFDRWRIPVGTRVILFGAVRGRSTGLKGSKTLVAALQSLADVPGPLENVMLVTFGGAMTIPSGLGIPHLELGPISTVTELADVYSCATFTAVPSIVESFGQVAAESLACGTPVLSFAAGGIADVVTHKVSGYLAHPQSVSSLSAGIEWLLSQDENTLNSMGAAGRQHVVKTFSESSISESVIRLYRELCTVAADPDGLG
jgi:glycosyltransferase involved in cell wall biosynthesis